MGQGRREEGKEEVKKATFTTLLTMVVDLALPLARFTLQISNLEIFSFVLLLPSNKPQNQRELWYNNPQRFSLIFLAALQLHFHLLSRKERENV